MLTKSTYVTPSIAEELTSKEDRSEEIEKTEEEEMESSNDEDFPSQELFATILEDNIKRMKLSGEENIANMLRHL